MFHIETDAKSGVLATATVGSGGPVKLAMFEPAGMTTQPEAVTRVEIHLRLAGKEDEPALTLSDQLANTVGLKPRHMRRATDLLPTAAPAPPDVPTNELPPTPLWYLTEAVLGVDRSTPELRSRIGKAKTAVKSAVRLPPQVALPALVAVPVVVGTCLGIGDLVFGW